MSLFGPLTHVGELEDAVEQTLQTWMNTGLREIERQKDLDQLALQPIRSWSVLDDNPAEKFPEAQLPGIQILSGSTIGEPVKDGRGMYSATWEIGVAVVAAGKGQRATRRLAHLYGLVIREVLVHHPSLGGFAAATDFVAERPVQMEPDGRRSLAGMIVAFQVQVRDIVDASQGPLVPDPAADPDGADWPTVQTVDIQLEEQPIT